MEPQHQQTLEYILKQTPKEFEEWLACLTSEEMTYVEWLCEKAEEALDELILEKSGLTEATREITKIMEK
jgi:hypothetical protein